ncbi:Hypothetical protein NTJ_04138 [Nesidiocoris tenuis]|uniref:Uncharacterized protein n=1 Tax=Nesidiocoris tenuis TaxID=355587 RepID=A0ABN7AGE0_9HEMI|nr:Hypothetical protein NTJ_04138 [Nesidiocoris tenuis]
MESHVIAREPKTDISRRRDGIGGAAFLRSPTDPRCRPRGGPNPPNAARAEGKPGGSYSRPRRPPREIFSAPEDQRSDLGGSFPSRLPPAVVRLLPSRRRSENERT